MQVNLREARREDCPRLLELVHELALFEKAPQEVDVSLAEFEDAGFGAKPVWKAFVAEVDVYRRFRAVLCALLHLERLPHLPRRPDRYRKHARQRPGQIAVR